MTKTKRSDVDLLIFDLDGTLLDTALYIVLNYLHLFEKYRVKVPTLTEMVYFSGPPLTTILPKYFPDVPLPTLLEEFEAFSLLKANRYSSLYEGEKDVLRELKEAGYYLAVLTSKRRRPAEDNLTHFGIRKFFDAILCLDECPRPKPDPAGVHILLDCLDVPPERTFIIGDSKTDIECGRNAGTNTGLVTFGLKKTDDILADERYGSYQDIERSFIHERQ